MIRVGPFLQHPQRTSAARAIAEYGAAIALALMAGYFIVQARW
jgi:hypothetical protein